MTEGSATGIARMTRNDLRLITTDPHDDIAAVEEQLVALMDRYEHRIYAYLMNILHDRDLALDCAQDTFLRAYEALRKGKAINAKWLYTVARNRAMDEFRRRRQLHSDAEAIEDAFAEERPVEGALDVQTVMERMPPLDREVLYLFEVAGFRTDEIGAMLGVRGTAVRQRLSRARKKFRLLYSLDEDETDQFRASQH